MPFTFQPVLFQDGFLEAHPKRASMAFCVGFDINKNWIPVLVILFQSSSVQNLPKHPSMLLLVTLGGIPYAVATTEGKASHYGRALTAQLENNQMLEKLYVSRWCVAFHRLSDKAEARKGPWFDSIDCVDIMHFMP